METIVFTPCPALCTIIPLQALRKTEGVTFDTIPSELLEVTTGGERVLHRKGAQSPGVVGKVERPWYCHRCQDDNLLVLWGDRRVDLYHPSCHEVFTFTVSVDHILCGDSLLYEGGAILQWKAGVFHRIISSPVHGSASINFAQRYAGFDIRHEFDIYHLDCDSGNFRVIRDGYLDQA